MATQKRGYGFTWRCGNCNKLESTAFVKCGRCGAERFKAKLLRAQKRLTRLKANEAIYQRKVIERAELKVQETLETSGERHGA